MSDFFKRKEAKGIDIPDAGNYDLGLEDSLKACGIDQESMNERHNAFFSGGDGFKIAQGVNPVAGVAARFEDHFSKRELAFFLSADLLKAIKAQREEKEKEASKHPVKTVKSDKNG